VHGSSDLRFHARDIKQALEAYEGDFGQNPDLHLQDGGCNRYLACLSTRASIDCVGWFIHFYYAFDI